MKVARKTVNVCHRIVRCFGESEKMGMFEQWAKETGSTVEGPYWTWYRYNPITDRCVVLWRNSGVIMETETRFMYDIWSGFREQKLPFIA